MSNKNCILIDYALDTYRNALEAGDADRAEQIRAGNPDLGAQFDKIDTEQTQDFI